MSIEIVTAWFSKLAFCCAFLDTKNDFDYGLSSFRRVMDLIREWIVCWKFDFYAILIYSIPGTTFTNFCKNSKSTNINFIWFSDSTLQDFKMYGHLGGTISVQTLKLCKKKKLVFHEK